jgi:hypothetical protein
MIDQPYGSSRSLLRGDPVALFGGGPEHPRNDGAVCCERKDYRGICNTQTYEHVRGDSIEGRAEIIRNRARHFEVRA